MNRRFVAGILVSLLAGALTLTGCGGAKKEGGTAGGAATQRSLTVGGSTALQPLVEEAARQYEAKTRSAVNVQGGGSGTGLSQTANGTFDIGNSDIFAEEKSGVDAGALVDHKVAVVGMAPVVNPSVGVKGITKQQLKDIFTAKVTNWKQVGGADQAVVVINRAKGSGTRAVFEMYGLDGTKPIEAQEQDSNGTVRTMVAQTPGAISYLAFAYFANNIVALELDGAAPTEENVTTGKWPIWSYEHMYTKGEPDAAEKAFLDFMLSADVQNNLVKQMGYVPVTGMKVQRELKK